MVQVRGDFRIAVVAHPGQMGAGFGIGKYRVRAKQRERKAQFAGEGGKPAQQGHIAHAAALRRIVAGKQPLFFHIKAHNHAQGGFVCLIIEGCIGGAVSHISSVSPSRAHGNAGRAQAALLGGCPRRHKIIACILIYYEGVAWAALQNRAECIQ